MPTIIALDASLSMSQPFAHGNSSQTQQIRHLAVHGVNTLLDFINVTAKLEFTALLCFSYLWELVHPFSRDFESLKAALSKVELYNKTCIETALSGINSVVCGEWGTGVLCQVILVTDGCSGVGHGSLRHSLETHKKDSSIRKAFPLPFSFPAKIHILCVSDPGDAALIGSLPLYQELIDINGQGGQIYTLEKSVLSVKAVEEMFHRCAEDNYTSSHVLLQCGNLKCSVQLHPKPEPHHSKEADFQITHHDISDTVDIVGFLDVSDVSSPTSLSRHLVLPTSAHGRFPTGGMEDSNKENGRVDVKDDEEESVEDGKTPTFAVLLHGSLKVENMVAVVKVGEEWFGMLYSWADNKKKSNLMLSIFEPGLWNIPWLGNLENLCPAGGTDVTPTMQFPVRPVEKRSYAQSCVVWIKDSGIQSDMQKVLRHARKLPDKQQQFYKEMNHIRRAALSFGFHELLEAMAAMLERECTLLPGTAHPSASMQLSHAANGLRSLAALDIAHTITPLQTNFSPASLK